jgi:PAS domain S-box-containing protein
VKRPLHIDQLSWRLGVSVAVIVVAALTGAFLLVYRFHVSHFLATVRSHALVQGYLIRAALEHDMLANDRTLVRRMVKELTREIPVERVMILDRKGEVQVSSDPAIARRHFAESSPTCQKCHASPPAERTRTTTLEVEGGTLLRVVEPIPNRPACHGCHSPRHRINGVLIVDVPLQETLSRSERWLKQIALGTGVIGLLLLGGIGLAFRRLVMRRLVRFEATARAIAHGDLARRVPIEGSDALTRLELQFNQMADSVQKLLTQLVDQRASLEKVMNSVDDGLVVLDRSRLVVAANEAFGRRFRRAAAELIGRPCCGAGEGRAGFDCGASGECPTQACFASGRVETGICSRAGSDGSERLEEVRASPVHGQDGGVTHVVEVWRDITDRRSAEARLANYQRMVSLGMLASGFSHEVNTPLASIDTCLHAITRLCGAEGPLAERARGEVLEYVRIASKQVERCGGITQQFLHLARGKTLDREVVELPAMAAAVARLATPTAKEAGVTIEVEPASSFPSVLANGSAVQQVLLNLLLNAIHASSRGQVVRVSFRAEDEIQLLVHDEGKGISAEDLPRVFEPFFSRREQGIGLGLFVSLNFARGWGGDLRPASAPGAGTTFTVVFPCPASSSPT